MCGERVQCDKGPRSWLVVQAQQLIPAFCTFTVPCPRRLCSQHAAAPVMSTRSSLPRLPRHALVQHAPSCEAFMRATAGRCSRWRTGWRHQSSLWTRWTQCCRAVTRVASMRWDCQLAFLGLHNHIDDFEKSTRTLAPADAMSDCKSRRKPAVPVANEWRPHNPRPEPGLHAHQQAMRKIKTEFMMHWDGLRTLQSDRVLVLAATNRPGQSLILFALCLESGPVL